MGTLGGIRQSTKREMNGLSPSLVEFMHAFFAHLLRMSTPFPPARPKRPKHDMQFQEIGYTCCHIVIQVAQAAGKEPIGLV